MHKQGNNDLQKDYFLNELSCLLLLPVLIASDLSDRTLQEQDLLL